MNNHHVITDTDPHFIIDGKTRLITNINETKKNTHARRP